MDFKRYDGETEEQLLYRIGQRKEEIGTWEEICKILTELTKEKGSFTVIGGGDSASAAAQMGYKEGFSHVSTGGGASLELIQNEGHLPGIDVIADK